MLSQADEPADSYRPDARAGSHLFPAGQLIPFILVTVLFFLWGIPNNLNDVLIRHFMKSFAISRFQAGLVQSAFYMGYFLLASGLSFLETASNPFIAQLGDPDSSERRLNFAQAFNPIGAITGALIGTIFIFSGIELTPQEIAAQQARHTYEAYLRSETLRVVKPYLVIGAIALIWAMLILRTKFPSIQSEHENGSGDRGHFRDLFRYPHFLFAVVAQFFYVGAQVGTWSYFISYVQEYAHQSEKVAGYFLTGTLAAFGIGRFASAWLMRFISPSKLMGAYSVANILLVGIAVFTPGWLGLWCVFLTSFFMSLMFPTIFALGLKGLGPNTKLGGSLLVMAIVGGAVLTPLMGFISVKTRSLALAYAVPLVAYLVIALYSFWGSHQRNTNPAAD